MLRQKPTDVLDKLANIALLTGMKARVNESEERIELVFGLKGNRTQVVYIAPTAERDDSVVITIMSPCLRVKKGFLSGISKKQALDLLRRNQQIVFARYGIWSNRDHDLIVASIDHILETLDPEEFKHSVLHVAIAADSYESEHGKDEF